MWYTGVKIPDPDHPKEAPFFMYLTRLYPAPTVYEECAGCFSFGGELRIFLPEGTNARPFAAMLETFCCTAARVKDARVLDA